MPTGNPNSPGCLGRLFLSPRLLLRNWAQQRAKRKQVALRALGPEARSTGRLGRAWLSAKARVARLRRHREREQSYRSEVRAEGAPEGWREQWLIPLRRLRDLLVRRSWTSVLRQRGPTLAWGLPSAAGLAAIVIASRLPSSAMASAGTASREWLRLRQGTRGRVPGPAVLRQLAQAAGASGQKSKRWRLLTAAAPLTATGDPLAQRELARLLLSRRPLRPHLIARATRRMRLALKGRPADDQIRWELASLLHRQKRPAEAVAILEGALPRRPDWAPLVVQLRWAAAEQCALDDPETSETHRDVARREAAALLERLKVQFEAEPAQLPIRIQLARVLHILGRHLAVCDVLGDPAHMRAAKRSQRRTCERLLARSLVELARTGNAAEQRDRLEQALRLDSGSLRALDLLSEIARTSRGAWAQQRLEGMLSQTQGDRATLHAMLAGRSWLAGEQLAAIEHLERAIKIDSPNHARIANDLAYMLAHRSQPQLERALTLIEQALAQSPDVPDFLDTRGRILVKLGRDRRAVSDLTAALPTSANKAELHTLIAGCCDRLGLSALAERHRVRAESD